MRFTAILGTRDEVDILPDAIDHLRRIGVDLIIVFDRGSTDGSLEYLSRAEEKGDLWLFSLPNDERENLLGRVRAALARATATDWVLFLDSDEFWLPDEGSLERLRSIRDADVLTVMRYNVVLSSQGPCFPRPIGPDAYGDALVIAQPVTGPRGYALDDTGAPWVMGLQEPKLMVRPEALVSTFPGEHEATVTGDRRWRRALATDVLVAHVPFRTFERFEQRSRNYQQMVSSQPEWFSDGKGRQWLHFARMADQERLREAWEQQVVGDAQLAELRDIGHVRSVADILAEPVPEYPSEERYLAAVGRAQPWINAAGLVARREGIDPQGSPAHVSTGHRPTVLIPPDHIVKVFSRWKDGLRILDQERAALRIMERDPGLPVPRARAEGSLDDAWRYLVLGRLPGVTFREVRHDLRDSAIEDAARWLGRFVRELHAVPLTRDERQLGLARFIREVTWRHANAARIMTDRKGLPPRLAEQVEAWLPPLDDFIPAPEELVLTHGDLNDEHILGLAHDGLFEPTGVIDFGEALIGHPLYDLGPIWWCVLRADRGLLATFLDEAALPGTTGPGFARRALAWAIIHPSWSLMRLPGIGEVETLDELAGRSFDSLERAKGSSVAPA